MPIVFIERDQEISALNKALVSAYYHLPYQSLNVIELVNANFDSIKAAILNPQNHTFIFSSLMTGDSRELFQKLLSFVMEQAAKGRIYGKSFLNLLLEPAYDISPSERAQLNSLIDFNILFFCRDRLIY